MKKIAFIAIVPAFIFLLSGCGAKKDNTPPIAPKTTVSQTTKPETTIIQPQETKAAQDQATAAATKQQATLPALSTDDKTAINSEISNIDQELKTTDSALSQDDLSDSQLGL